MKNISLVLILFSTLIIFGQPSVHLEDSIYKTIDNFTAQPSESGLKELSQIDRDFWKTKRPKTKEELLAIVILNCNKGYYEMKLGQNQSAIESYEKAWDTFGRNQLAQYDIIEYALKPLGNLYTMQGDYDNAENTIKQYYYIASKERNKSQKLAAILNLSNVYQSAGKTDLAIELLQKTLQTEKLTKTEKGIIINNLGNNYMLNYSLATTGNAARFKKIESTYLYAIQLLQGDENQNNKLANCYRNLATLYTQRRNFEIANDYFAKAKKLFFTSANQDSRQIARLYYEEASLVFEQQKYAEASTLISSVFKILIPNYSSAKSILPQSKSLYSETVLLDALDLQAAIFSIENKPKKALEAYTLSAYIEDLFSNLLIYENSKIINQTRVRLRTEKCIALYDLLFQKEKNQAYIEQAFQLAEKTKSTVLKSYLQKNKIATREEKLHIEQLQNWTVEITKEQQKGNKADITKISHAIEKQNELVLSLKKIQSINTSTENLNTDLNLVFEKLKNERTVLINYFSGAEKTYSFTFQDETILLKSYKNETNKTIVTNFLNYFKESDAISKDPKGYNHQGKIVYDLLQFSKLKKEKNLVIIPDGLLNFLPFEALITAETTTTNFSQMKYLVNDYAIGFNNSVTFYLNEVELEKPKKNVLGIFPVFEKTNYALDFSKKEMASIKSKFDGQFFENENATFANFKSNASSHTILHLSTHASAGDIDTPASIKFFDQEIVYSELYQLNINPELVVLSACETGIGKLYKSEGAMSIARGFQFAGARNLLFSLWKVNDFTTSVFMNYFYQHCKDGNSYWEANHNAKLDFIKDKTISNAKKSPYYWSAFVYYGSCTAGEETINYTFYILGFITVIGLLLAFIGYKNGKITRNPKRGKIQKDKI
ncbi:CHAT domain-containing protein [Flavobacterium sp. 7A]|uniref:CHAT domain-containing protein n=1 Tax=Flavobacterium sp. 7A TaxID=2940571 RepID=UPI0022272D99|nr:CHAT domain-containing protein [Flavobacterium sp. 7A]MCW2118211.1 CHAT domain-containing protein/lipopolysaccharide biosynthesis regulator YciM [Flavobacterium sp. 7A]